MFARPHAAAPMDNRAAAASTRDTSSGTLQSGRKGRRIKLKDVKGKKCWICFTEEGVDDQSIKNNDQWVHPCQCSLVAHKECFDDWLGSSRMQHLQNKVECPQCKARYKLEEDWFPLVSLSNIVKRAGTQIAPIAGVGVVASTALLTFTVYGCHAIFAVCGQDFAERLLGDSQEWSTRMWIGLPSIPVFLVASCTEALDDVFLWLPVSLILPRYDPALAQHAHLPDLGQLGQLFTTSPAPWAVMCYLPYMRAIYNYAWKKFIRPIELKWSVEIDPSLRISMEEALAQAQEAEAQRAAANGVRAPPQDPQRQQALRRQFQFQLTTRLEVSKALGALCLPTIASLMGSLVEYIPFLRNRLPEGQFYRSILGGCIFIVAKDMLSMLTLRQKVLQKRSRRIKNFDVIEDVQ